MADPLSNKDWLLISLAASKLGRMTPVQVQKTLFLLGKEAPKHVGPDFYQFEPYDYGPFNSTVYRDLESLAEDGAIAVEPMPMQRWPIYAITPAGEQRAAVAKQHLEAKTVEFVSAVVNWVTSLNFPDLVRAIYARYPDFKVKSVFNK